MEKPLLILKPSIINALVPTIIKNAVYSLVIVVVLYGVAMLFELGGYMLPNAIFLLIVLWVVLIVGSVAFKIIGLLATNYYFFRHHVQREYKLFVLKIHSIPYNQITNISTHISVWDRICRAGDIILYTAEDVGPNLILHYIKDPAKIERNIYDALHMRRSRG